MNNLDKIKFGMNVKQNLGYPFLADSIIRELELQDE